VSDHPDAVVIATGSEPVIPDMSGVNGPRVVTGWDILEGRKQAGNKVLIVGGGMVGCEVADFLGEHLHQVTLVEMLPEIASDIPLPVKYFLLQRLRDYGVQIETETSVVEFLDDGAIVIKNDKTVPLRGFDTIVLAMGTKSVDSLKNQLEEKISELYVIGDALAPRKAIEAIEEGAKIALKI
jgi:pyruvate/2-oxoglutarate dehydrogenase complex dihydrolipoamide dehydrogenase (E3) component